MKKSHYNRKIKSVFIVLILPFVAFSMLLVSSCIAQQTAPDDNGLAEVQKPVFTSEGRIVCGGKSLWKKTAWPQIQMCIDNDAICKLYEIFNFGQGDINPVFFLNKESQTTENSVIYTCDVRESPSSDKNLGEYKLSMTLLENGLAKIEAVCQLKDPALMPKRYCTFQFPPYMKLSGEYTKGKKTISFNEKKHLVLTGEQLNDAIIRFFPGSDAKSFSIIPKDCSEIKINSNSIALYAKNTGVMSFLLDISGAKTTQKTTELSPNGIDFWNIDKLHLPDYGACRNLVSNPSFEAGFHYWGYLTYTHGIIPLKYSNFYEIDAAQANSGLQSLRIKALPIRTPLPLGTMAIPFVPGQEYTLSFYAKGAADKDLTLNVWGRGQRTRIFTDVPSNIHTLSVDKNWRRYSISFTPKERFCSVFFDAKVSTEKESCVWIDDVQIEQGAATDFVQPPVSAQLISSARGNFLEFGQKPDFTFDIQSASNTKGTVSISIEDFFFKTIFSDTYKFKTNSSGKASIQLNNFSDSLVKNKLRGVFCVNAIFNIDGVDRPFKEYFRFSVMDFLTNTHKNKDIFNLTYVYSIQSGGPDMERFMQRERAVGFGSICYDFIRFANDLDYDLDRERMQLVKKYGFGYMGRPVLKLHDGQGGEISENQIDLKMVDIKTKINPTDEELKEFEDICAAKAKNRPWNDIWWFTGESNPGCMPLESHPDAFAKFLIATNRGIKKGNPNAKVLIEGGPWTMAPELGTKWVERYIQDTRRIDPNVQFDGAAAHHYRDFPENPDLDTEIGAFIEMLDRNGCKDWPFYINEGGNYCPFNIPQEGISPYIVHSANAWYIRPLSYHSGRSERISAAFSARNWIIALKYHDRVACMQDFMTPNRYVDIDFTPRFYEKIPNTLGRLLGDASFYKDNRFAPYCRSYIFTDDKTGAAIAAIWNHKESVDRWKEEPPLYKFDFSQQDVKFIDLMENEVSYPKDADGKTIIPISSFPMFVKGKSGSQQQLYETITKAVAASDDMQTLDIHAFPTASGDASVILKNIVSSDFVGEVDVKLNGKQSNMSIELPPLGQKEVQIDLQKNDGKYGKLLPFDFACSVDKKEFKHISNNYMLLKNNSALDIDSDISDWKNIPSVDIGSGFLLRMAVSNGNFLAVIESNDKNSTPLEVFNGVGLYFDPFGKTEQWYLPRAAKQDLAIFEFKNALENTLGAYCHYVQGTQAGSGTKVLVAGKIQKMIKVKTSASDEGTFMMFSVPQEVLAPLILKPSSRFGLNISLPLKENNVKTLAPVKNFKNPNQPGDINFVSVIVCD